MYTLEYIVHEINVCYIYGIQDGRCVCFRTSGNMNTEEATVSSNVASKPLPHHVSQVPHSRSGKRKGDSFERDIVDIFKTNAARTTPQLPDPDEMFLLSQVPIIKQMKLSDKLDFQVRFMQLLRSYTVPSTDPLSATCYDSTPTSVTNPHPIVQQYIPSPSHSSIISPTHTPSPVDTQGPSDDDSMISFFNL